MLSEHSLISVFTEYLRGKSFAMSVRHIHTQAQAQVELERQRAAQRASYIRWKETMLNDPEYREQVLQSWKIGRDKK